MKLTELHHTPRPSWRLFSLEQFSTTVANALRAKKPPTRKDAVNINKWRFPKLKDTLKGTLNQRMRHLIGTCGMPVYWRKPSPQGDSCQMASLKPKPLLLR